MLVSSVRGHPTRREFGDLRQALVVYKELVRTYIDLGYASKVGYPVGEMLEATVLESVADIITVALWEERE